MSGLVIGHHNLRPVSWSMDDAKDGVSALSIKDELLSLEAMKAALQSRLEAPEMPEPLHPRMSDVYREKVGTWA